MGKPGNMPGLQVTQNSNREGERMKLEKTTKNIKKNIKKG